MYSFLRFFNPENLLVAFAATSAVSVIFQNILPTAALLWAYSAWKNGARPEWPRRFFTWATVLFVATFYVSAATGVDPSNSFHGVNRLLVLPLLFPVAAMQLGPVSVRRILYAYTAGAGLCSLWGILHFVITKEERLRSFSGHYWCFAGLLMLALLMGVFFLRRNPSDRWSWVFFVLNLVALILTQTRGAWIALAAGFALWAFFTSRKLLVAGCAALTVVFLVIPSPGRDRMLDLFQRNARFQRSSSMERVHMWRSGTRIIRDHPIWGIGHDNVRLVYPAYKEKDATESNIGHLHNNFIQIPVQNGWTGLFAYLLWLFAYGWTVLRNRPSDPEKRSLWFLFTCTFVGCVVWGFTEFTFGSHQYLGVQALLLGLQLGLAHSLSGIENKSVPARSAK